MALDDVPETGPAQPPVPAGDEMVVAGDPRGLDVPGEYRAHLPPERANPSAPLEERCAAMGVTPETRDAAALAAEALGEEDYEDLA